MTRATKRKNYVPPYVLIEGPRLGDAKFYGRWLLAIAKADALCSEINRADVFSSTGDLPQFATHATALLSSFDRNGAIAMVPVKVWEDFQALAMLVGMGFLARTGHRYQMTIPPNLTMAKVKNAALTIAEANTDEDGWDWLGLLVTITQAQAHAWKDCLSLMGEGARSTEREWLLEGARHRKTRRVGSKEDGPSMEAPSSCVGIPQTGDRRHEDTSRALDSINPSKDRTEIERRECAKAVAS